MKKMILISVLLGIIAAPVFAVPTVNVTRQAGYYDPTIGSGRGEFTLMPSDDLKWVLNLYAPVARGTDTFQSFCLEALEHVPLGQTYEVVLNDRAINGGVGPQGDPISIGTAWLYHEFQMGTLEGYDYTAGTGRATSARDLQWTIWYLENEDIRRDNPFLTLVEAKFANPMVDNNYSYPVAVLNLYNLQGGLAQDMLVCVPAPGAILLGSIGVSIVGWMRRRRTL